jgi:hypothetical protein
MEKESFSGFPNLPHEDETSPSYKSNASSDPLLRTRWFSMNFGAVTFVELEIVRLTNLGFL